MALMLCANESSLILSKKELHQAAASNQLERVKELLSQWLDLQKQNPNDDEEGGVSTSSSTSSIVDAPGEDGLTALMYAGFMGHINMVKYFIEVCKANVEARDKSGNNALHLASRRGHSKIVQYLIEACHVDIEARTINGCTALHCACKDGHLAIVKYLIKKCDANADARSYNSLTPLHCAVASVNGHLPIVQYLILECHVDKEAKNNLGWTVLHYACREGHRNIVQFLLNDCHVNVAHQDNSGCTALHAASALGSLDIVRLLIQFNAYVEAKTRIGMTALHFASTHGHFDIVQYFLTECQANAEVKDQSGYTALHFASQKGCFDIVKLLVQKHKVSVNAKGNAGSTALHLACSKGNLDIVRFLLEQRGVDGLAKDCSGCTALHIASREGHLNVVRFLIEECRFDQNITDNEGNTAHGLASAFGKSYIVDYLNDAGDGPTTSLLMNLPCMTTNFTFDITNEESSGSISKMDDPPSRQFVSCETEVTATLPEIDDFPDSYSMEDLPHYAIVLGAQDRKVSSLGISSIYRTLRSQQDTCEILYFKLLRYFKESEYSKNNDSSLIPTHEDQLLFVYVDTDEKNDDRRTLIPIHRKKIPSKDETTPSPREIRDYHVSVDLKLDRRKLITLDQKVENLSISIQLKHRALASMDLPYKNYVPVVSSVLTSIEVDLHGQPDADAIEKHRRCIAFVWETYMPTGVGPTPKRQRNW